MKDSSTAVSKEQVKKAVDALLKYVGKQKEESKNLIEDEDFLYLVRVHGMTCMATILNGNLYPDHGIRGISYTTYSHI